MRWMVRNKEYQRVCKQLEEARYEVERLEDINKAQKTEINKLANAVEQLKTECADLRSIAQELLCKKPYKFDPYAISVIVQHYDSTKDIVRTYEFRNPLHVPIGLSKNLDFTQRIETNLPPQEVYHD